MTVAGSGAVVFGSSPMAATAANATAKKQRAVRGDPGFMPPIVDAGHWQRQAFGLRDGNPGSLPAKIRPAAFWTPGLNSVFNSNIRLFWYVPFAVFTAKQVVNCDRVFQNSCIYGIRMRCFAAA